MSSVAPTVIKPNFSDFSGANMLPVLEMLYKSNSNLAGMIRDQLFSTIQARHGIAQYSEVHSTRSFLEIAEGEEFTYAAPNQGADKTYTLSKYGLAVSISREMIRDNKFDMVQHLIEQLARSAQETREVQALDILNNAFSGTTVADGAALVAASHTLPSGQTYRNRLSSDADLSQSTLDIAVADFESEFVTDTGQYLGLKPRFLVVHSDNRRYAKELLQSEGKPDTMDNNLNAFRDEGMTVLSSPRLTDTNAWFLIGDKRDNGLTIAEDGGIMTRGWEDPSRQSIIYSSSYRWKTGANHGYGIIGTSGAS